MLKKQIFRVTPSKRWWQLLRKDKSVILDTEKPKSIFINYHHKDIMGIEDTLYKTLDSFFPGEVFLDNKKMDAGEIFPDILKRAVKGCKLFLAVIGPNWDHEEYLKKLNEPNDWVRQELELALEHEIPIIPIFIRESNAVPNIEKLPQSLRRGIFERITINLGLEHLYWPHILREKLHVISKYTGLQPVLNNTIPLDERYKKLTFCLDRSEEILKIKESRNNNNWRLSASGSEHSHYEAFVERCSLDSSDMFSEVLAGAIVKQLSYTYRDCLPEQFTEEVLKRIAKALSLDYKQLEGEDLIEAVRNRLQGKQKYIFWAIRRGGSAHQHSYGFSGKWWDTWETVIGNRENSNILVLVFTVTGRLNGLNFTARFNKGKPHYIGRFKDKINNQCVQEWHDNFNVYVKNCELSETFDLEHMQKKHEEHFKGNSFAYKDAVDKLQALLASAFKPKKTI